MGHGSLTRVADALASKMSGAWAWLTIEPGPRNLLQGRGRYGTRETSGTASNLTILQWARGVGIDCG